MKRRLATLLIALYASAAFAADGGLDAAAWIGEAEEAPATRFLRFRCPFDGADEPLRVTLSADQRYVLMLDGAVVGRGPAFGDVNNWHSQTLTLAPGVGRHLLEAVVWRLGTSGFSGDRPSAQMTYRTGFILKADGGYDAKLTTAMPRG